MRSVCIQINHRGNLANKMFQYMFAKFLQSQIPDSYITGLDIPEFNFPKEEAQAIPKSVVRIRGHDARVDKIIYAARVKAVTLILLDGYFQDVRYYDNSEKYSSLFSHALPIGDGFDESHLVFNIRAGDIIKKSYDGYWPLPFDYYKFLIASTGLKPVFTGQWEGSSHFHQQLKENFPDAQFVKSMDPLYDFARLMASKNLAVPISTFAWLAAWFSRADRIFYPVYGLFDPNKRPDINLMPIDDPRFRFMTVRGYQWVHEKLEHERAEQEGEPFEQMNHRELTRLLRGTFLQQ